MFKPVEFPPGVRSTPTKSSSSVNWSAANLMRWERGKIKPIGGWSKLNIGTIASNVRAVHRWYAYDGVFYTAYLCDEHLYIESEGTVVDISPTTALAAPSDDYTAGGFGDSTYNYDEYGNARPANPDKKSIGFAFTLDNWGENLLAMSSVDGRLLMWAPGDTEAAPVTGAPTGNRSFVVTPERHVMLFDYGGNIGEIAWCSKEDIEEWGFADTTNTAGTLPIEPKSKAVASKLVNGGVIFFNTTAAYVSRYIGLPYIYDKDSVGSGCIPISDRSVCRTNKGAVWLSENGVWEFDGVSVNPVECPVWNWLTELVDWKLARFLSVSVHLSFKSEVWMFFPAVGGNKNSHYVCYNYLEGWWSTGIMGRSAGVTSSYVAWPIMADDTVVYEHENSASMPGITELPWAETYAFQSSGGYVLNFQQMMPDIEGDVSGLRFSLKYRTDLGTDERQSPVRQSKNGLVSFNVSGIDFKLRIENTDPLASSWTVGNSRVDIQTRGKRP